MTKHYNNRGKGYIKKICFNIKQLFNSLFIRMLDKLKLICSTLKSYFSGKNRQIVAERIGKFLSDIPQANRLCFNSKWRNRILYHL